MSNDTLTDIAAAGPVDAELGAVEVKGMTRSSFILRGAIAAGSVYGVSTVAPFVSQALAAGGSGDVEILNFALTLEYLESAFYNEKGKDVGLERPGEVIRQAVRRTGGTTTSRR